MTPIRRGDIVVISAAGDYGKPRPAVVIQSAAMPPEHASVVLCQLTSTLVNAADFRVTVYPTQTNGLRERYQVMADKPVTLMRSRIGRPVGRLAEPDLARVTAAISFVLGLAD